MTRDQGMLPYGVGPWRRAAPKAQDRVPHRGTIHRSGQYPFVLIVIPYRHSDGSGGIFVLSVSGIDGNVENDSSELHDD